MSVRTYFRGQGLVGFEKIDAGTTWVVDGADEGRAFEKQSGTDRKLLPPLGLYI